MTDTEAEPSKAQSARSGRAPARQRDSERTRRRLLDAAETVFAKNGLEGASTEDIARRAGVSKTMLFYYFQTKEQLYLEVLKRLFESVLNPQRALEIEKMEPRDALSSIASDYFDIHVRRPTYAELTLRETMIYGGKYLERLKFDLPFVGLLMRVLRKGSLGGQFRDVDPLKTTISLIGMTKIVFAYRQAIERVLTQDVLSPEGAKEWKEHVIDVLTNGVGICAPGAPKPDAPDAPISRALSDELLTGYEPDTN